MSMDINFVYVDEENNFVTYMQKCSKIVDSFAVGVPSELYKVPYNFGSKNV